MSRAVELDSEYKKEELAQLLNKAKGCRSQRQFAADCCLSHTHLNRYFVQKKDTPPTPATLFRIAQASDPPVSFEELLSAAGYDPEKYTDFHSDFAGFAFINEEPLPKDQLKSFATTAIRDALWGSDFSWEKVPARKDSPFEFEVKITDKNVIKNWAFTLFLDKKLMGTGQFTKEAKMNLDASLGAMTYFFPEESAKLSIATDSQEIYEALIDGISPTKLRAYVSVILVDLQAPSFVEETYLKTDLAVTDEIVNLYRLYPTYRNNLFA